MVNNTAQQAAAALGQRELVERAYTCTGCGETAMLSLRDPLPTGWTTRLLGRNGAYTKYFCSPACRDGGTSSGSRAASPSGILHVE